MHSEFRCACDFAANHVNIYKHLEQIQTGREANGLSCLKERGVFPKSYTVHDSEELHNNLPDRYIDFF